MGYCTATLGSNNKNQTWRVGQISALKIRTDSKLLYELHQFIDGNSIAVCVNHNGFRCELSRFPKVSGIQTALPK
jgi:hypothetical protein